MQYEVEGIRSRVETGRQQGVAASQAVQGLGFRGLLLELLDHLASTARGLKAETTETSSLKHQPSTHILLGFLACHHAYTTSFRDVGLEVYCFGK